MTTQQRAQTTQLGKKDIKKRWKGREGRGKLNLKHLFCEIVGQGEELQKKLYQIELNRVQSRKQDNLVLSTKLIT